MKNFFKIFTVIIIAYGATASVIINNDSLEPPAPTMTITDWCFNPGNNSLRVSVSVSGVCEAGKSGTINVEGAAVYFRYAHSTVGGCALAITQSYGSASVVKRCIRELPNSGDDFILTISLPSSSGNVFDDCGCVFFQVSGRALVSLSGTLSYRGGTVTASGSVDLASACNNFCFQ